MNPSLQMGKLRQEGSVMEPGSGQAAGRPRQHSGRWHLVLDISAPSLQVRALRPQGQESSKGDRACQLLSFSSAHSLPGDPSTHHRTRSSDMH